MQSSLRVFGWLFCLTAIIATFRLRSGPPQLVLMVAPVFTLYTLLGFHQSLKNKPRSHWWFRCPGLWRFRKLLHVGLSLPLYHRALIVCFCIFGGWGVVELMY